MTLKRIVMHLDYLIVSPNSDNEQGFRLAYVERPFLVEGIFDFLEKYPDVDAQQITIYELKEINE